MPRNSNSKIFFQDRLDAARQMIEDIPVEGFKKRDVIIIAASEGGVIIADKLAQAIETKMDILLSEPVYAPNNPELPIAMVSETKELVMNRQLVDSFGIDEDYIYDEAEKRYEAEILSYPHKYRLGGEFKAVKGKSVILVDESIETGLTMMTAIKSMISLEAKNVYVAAPVLDKAVYENLVQVCDGVFCPHIVSGYISVEYYYDNLEKPTLNEIERIIDKYE